MRMKRVEIAWLNHLNMVEHHDCVLHVVASDAHGPLHFPSNSVCVKCNNHNLTESGKWCWNAPQRPHPCNWDVQIDIRNFNQRQFQHITFDCCTSVCFFPQDSVWKYHVDVLDPRPGMQTHYEERVLKPTSLLQPLLLPFVTFLHYRLWPQTL